MALKNTILAKAALLVGPPLFRILSWLLFSSCRIEHVDRKHLDSMEPPFIGAFWHYSILYWLHLGRRMNTVAMVSGSRDGEYVARILRSMGIEAVRGSRTKGGLAALKKLQKAMERGCFASLVADGSQGPPLKVQAGVILLASRSGRPILTGAWAADRYVSFRSWDRTVLPKPFARLAVFYGEPMYVPGNLRSGDLEKYRLQLEARLLALYRKAWGRFGKEIH